MARVFMVEDQVSFADALASVLGGAGHEVVAVAHDEDTAMTVLDGADFEVALLDVALGDHEAGGIRIAECIRSRHPAAKIVFLTSHARPDGAVIHAVFRFDPDGVLTKQERAARIAEAIDEVVVGGRPISAELAPFAGAGPGQMLDRFTSAERRVLVELASHPDSRSRLAARLGVSSSTLDNHLTSIKRKVLEDLVVSGERPRDGYISMEALIGWARERDLHLR